MAEAFQVLAEIEVELRACEPNHGAVASRLERFVELLSDAGSADLPVVRSTRAIATWVGRWVLRSSSVSAEAAPLP